MLNFRKFFILCLAMHIEYSTGYQQSLDHAKIARKLVHQSNWTAFGTISANSKISGYPMVNVISVDDSNQTGSSTGLIHFMLTDLDFTGSDWRATNKVTLLFTDEQNKNCAKVGKDPMEPTCARIIISGKVLELDKKSKKYEQYLAAFVKRHPAAENWMKGCGNCYLSFS